MRHDETMLFCNCSVLWCPAFPSLFPSQRKFLWTCDDACFSWMDVKLRGSCHDAACRFSHSLKELRAPPDLTKTVPRPEVCDRQDLGLCSLVKDLKGFGFLGLVALGKIGFWLFWKNKQPCVAPSHSFCVALIRLLSAKKLLAQRYNSTTQFGTVECSVTQEFTQANTLTYSIYNSLSLCNIQTYCPTMFYGLFMAFSGRPQHPEPRVRHLMVIT